MSREKGLRLIPETETDSNKKSESTNLGKKVPLLKIDKKKSLSK